MPSSGVMLDACVLANFSLCDTLLRLAETPVLYQPRWSAQILAEARRTLETKLNWPAALAAHFESELLRNFPNAMVEGHEALIANMPNEAKDRHVLAAAVHSNSPLVLTFNLRDFRPQDTLPLGVRATHPQQFLNLLFEEDAKAVLRKLEAQASERKRSLSSLLDLLARTVPEFAANLRSRLDG